MERKTMEQRIEEVLRNHKKLLAKGIAKRIRLGRRERGHFFEALARLQEEGRVSESGGYYALAPRGRTFEGIIRTVHGGFAFAADEGSGEEFFIPGRFLLGALPGDQVLLQEKPSRGEKREAQVLRLLTAGEYRVSGTFYQQADGSCWLCPDGELRQQLPVRPGGPAARDGDKVLARIQRGKSGREHCAELLLSTGSAQDARACARAVLLAQGVPESFSPEALGQAEALLQAGVSPEALQGRLDLREELVFTIDGAHSKDLDDAVSLRMLPQGGYELGVHIADVSCYVQPQSALDEEAYERGTSIYFADQVVPMLPPALSNGICSLNPGEDRLALSALLQLNADYELTGFRFCRSVIRSKLRGVYEQVNALLCGSAAEEIRQSYAPVEETLRSLDRLAKSRVARRRAMGAVDLHSVETEFDFDEAGNLRAIAPRVSGAAESLIEECMLLANEAAARYAAERELPFIYRIHEPPPEDRVEALFSLLRRLGLQAKRPKGELAPALLRDILASVQGKELETVVNAQILRAMSKARYSAQNVGHYGLGLPLYTHFTSPIRRYPDLCIHRILSGLFSGEEQPELMRHYGRFVEAASEQSSRRELRAMQVERQCDSCFIAGYLSARLGETAEGTVSSVTPYGFYVLLDNSAEGMVRLETLGEPCDYDGAIQLTGVRTGRQYRVGQRIRIRIEKAEVSSGRVDFSPLLPEGEE
ncbi:MAG: VacB/RNase II family 3'-5' exoribonuclease [Provencibacterium sp.]|jgi:ribonuclease R|nr:VacB/RNase II family 3'-5' exoribonuclease [Provencibacterium sp.]